MLCVLGQGGGAGVNLPVLEVSGEVLRLWKKGTSLGPNIVELVTQIKTPGSKAQSKGSQHQFAIQEP